MDGVAFFAPILILYDSNCAMPSHVLVFILSAVQFHQY